MRHLRLMLFLAFGASGLYGVYAACGSGQGPPGPEEARPVVPRAPGSASPAPPERDAPSGPEQAAAPLPRTAADEPEPAPIPQGRPPPPDPYSMYAVAFHHVAEVYEAPRRGARVIGYLRRGTKLRVKPRASRRGCQQGWHELRVGGFVCDGRGVLVRSEPVDFEPSPKPARLDAALPYAYGSITKDGTLSFYRIPTRAEELAAERAVEEARLPSVEEAVQDAPSQATATEAPTGPSGSAGAGAERSDEPPDSPPDATAERESNAELAAEATAADAASDHESAAERAAEAAAADAAPAGEGARVLPELVEAVLLGGFFLSIDGRIASDDRRVFYRTVRNRFVRANRVIPAKAPTFHGVRLTESRNLPVAFLARAGVDALRRGPGSRLRKARRLRRLTTFFPVGDSERNLLSMRDGSLVRRDRVVLVRRRELPRGLRDGEKWIDVDLATQTLVAYEGTEPVFATLVTTGRDGFETPRGSYRIQSKHVAATMDDPTSPDEAYSIEDVPWTMYFKDSLALHGAFWHRNFGRVRSHGCVNLAPADARWLFLWTDPPVPEVLHGVMVKPGHGTRVVIH